MSQHHTTTLPPEHQVPASLVPATEPEHLKIDDFPFDKMQADLSALYAMLSQFKYTLHPIRSEYDSFKERLLQLTQSVSMESSLLERDLYEAFITREETFIERYLPPGVDMAFYRQFSAKVKHLAEETLAQCQQRVTADDLFRFIWSSCRTAFCRCLKASERVTLTAAQQRFLGIVIQNACQQVIAAKKG